MNVLDAVSPLERIQLSGELAGKVKALAGPVTALERIRLARGIADLLERLGAVVATAAKWLAFSLADKEGSLKALNDYMDTGIKSMPSSLVPFEMQTISALAATIDGPATSRRANDVATLAVNSQATMDKTLIAAYDEIASRGVVTGLDIAKVLANVEASAELLKKTAADDPAFVAANALLGKLSADFKAADAAIGEQLRAEREAIRLDPERGKVQIDALHDQRAAIYEKYLKDFGEAKPVAQKALEQFNADKVKAGLAMFEADGELVISALLNASPVTHEQSVEWASKQIIDPNALTKLARLGYKKADVFRDIAEFYRITGGKSSSIRISAGGRRASASGVDTRLDEKIINLGTSFNKTVLFHELAHHLENDPIAKAGSNGFLVKRRESATVYSLKGLTGHKYRADEGAYKDNFMNPYIGKVYRDGITEVFSMGVQYLSNPKDAAIFAAKDPEMFALITGYLSRDLTPAMHAKLNMHVGAIEDLTVKRQDETDQYITAISGIAKAVTLVNDGWWDDFRANEPYLAERLESYAFTRGKPPKFVGTHSVYHVFEGVFKNKNTGRAGKGFLVTGPSGRSIPDYAAIHGDIETVRAFIGIAENQGLSLSQTFYNMFYTKLGRNVKAAVIKSAQSILGSVQ